MQLLLKLLDTIPSRWYYMCSEMKSRSNMQRSLDELNSLVIEWLEQGHLPEQISEVLGLPVDWVLAIESRLID